ncbi:MAG: hypothetical protein HKN56_10465 [Gammaproteobacteria bacterium]|nr:hypothetical protein [Gammaproteobacteria bacterium]
MPPVPVPDAENLPYEAGTGPEDRSVPFLAWFADLTPDGYTEQEILMSGEANTYEYVDNDARTFDVQVATSGHPYTTRVLLRHPIDPADFNGVVYMEILNATARYDGAPMWDFTYPSIIADGAAWVGVTYSDTTANFMKNVWGTTNFPAPAGAQPRNRSRYSTLNVTSRRYAWDILSQAAALLKADWAGQNPLAGFGVDTIIVTGYSQSARYVTSYGNSFYPQYSTVPDDPIVDGYIVAAGGAVASTMDGAGFHRDAEADPRNFNRSGGYTVRFTTESDVGSARVRVSQDDNPRIRTYEAAGTSHVDLNGGIVGAQLSAYQFGVVREGFGCDLPPNPIRTGVPLSAAQHRLANWIQYGDRPPNDRLIDYDALNQEWLRDSDGNATGGVRTARIEVPLGTYTGDSPYSGDNVVTGILCRSIVGGFQRFSDAEIVDRYRNKRLFLLKTWGALLRQWLDGFLIPVDAWPILQEAYELEVEGLPDRPQRKKRPRRSGQR